MECNIGIVKDLKPEGVVVVIERQSACSACHAKGFCITSDKTSEEIVVSDYPEGLQVGERVRIIPVEGGTPLKAVLFAFVIPLVIMAVGAIVMNNRGLGDEIMLAVLIGFLLLYSLLLVLLRGFFERKFRLKVERLS